MSILLTTLQKEVSQFGSIFYFLVFVTSLLKFDLTLFYLFGISLTLISRLFRVNNGYCWGLNYIKSNSFGKEKFYLYR